MTTTLVDRQYAEFPYPARDPADEDKRLVTGSPSHWDEVRHHVFAGGLADHSPVRLLVAGGGTGDALVMLAQQTADAGIATDITYLDPSPASRAVAEARIARRGLGGRVRFVTGTIEDLARLAPGPFDYIDCCGVLHHLVDPVLGLRRLAGALSSDGGIGLMVYGAYGRTGVYPMQSALRRLAGPALADRDRLATARKLLGQLPASNWLKRNPFVSDHMSGDAGLYDLLLHARDQAYSVDGLVDLITAAGLTPAAFVPRFRYDPTLLIADAALRARARKLPWTEQAALAEELSGAINVHIAYTIAADRVPIEPPNADDPALRPILRDTDAASFPNEVRRNLQITANLGGSKASVPIPALAGPVIRQIDGHRTIAEIRDIITARFPRMGSETVAAETRETIEALIHLGKLHLRR